MAWSFLGLLYDIFGVFLIISGLVLYGTKYRFDAEIGFAFMIIGFFLQMAGSLGLPTGNFLFLAFHFYLPAVLALYVLFRTLETELAAPLDTFFQKQGRS